jgi:hypothetical protein
MSTLHATYLCCIKPYVNQDTVALEIGPGRNAWTKTLLPACEVYALDALSAEHNDFYEYVGRHEHVKYFQVSDFKCEMLPDNYFNRWQCLSLFSLFGILVNRKFLSPTGDWSNVDGTPMTQCP